MTSGNRTLDESIDDNIPSPKLAKSDFKHFNIELSFVYLETFLILVNNGFYVIKEHSKEKMFDFHP